MLYGWAWLKKNGDRFYDFVDSEVHVSFTRIEVLKIHKYLHPGYFLWVATEPRMIQASKERTYYYFKKLVRSPPRAAPRSNIQCS
jgi:hypothetical protein